VDTWFSELVELPEHTVELKLTAVGKLVEEGRSVIVLVEVLLVEVGRLMEVGRLVEVGRLEEVVRLELVLPELVEAVIPELEEVIELGTSPWP
jgi:hypothetical protein